MKVKRLTCVTISVSTACTDLTQAACVQKSMHQLKDRFCHHQGSEGVPTKKSVFSHQQELRNVEGPSLKLIKSCVLGFPYPQDLVTTSVKPLFTKLWMRFYMWQIIFKLYSRASLCTHICRYPQSLNSYTSCTQTPTTLQ